MPSPRLRIALVGLALIPGGRWAPLPHASAGTPETPGAAAAVSPEAAVPRDAAFQERLRRWRAMSPSDRARLIARYEQWKQLPPCQQERLTASLSTFQSMTLQQQAETRQGIRPSPPGAGKPIAPLAQRVHAISRANPVPPGPFAVWLRDFHPKEFESIQDLSPDERPEAIRPLVQRFLKDFVASFEIQLSDSEREAFRALPVEEKVVRVREWFAERRSQDPGLRAPFPWWDRPKRRATAPPRGSRGEPRGRLNRPAPEGP
jgi:hypothetical protein